MKVGGNIPIAVGRIKNMNLNQIHLLLQESDLSDFFFFVYKPYSDMNTSNNVWVSKIYYVTIHLSNHGYFNHD